MAQETELKFGQMVLAEIQPGVVVHAILDEIVDGIAYLTGDDGEPYCTTEACCDDIVF